MSGRLVTMREAIGRLVPDGSSVAMGLGMEAMIPFAAGHEMVRQRRRGLTLVGPISDVLFDQIVAGGCVRRVLAAWVGNVQMGSAYAFRRVAAPEALRPLRPRGLRVLSANPFRGETPCSPRSNGWWT